MIYTSGTTGKPKGVRISNKNIANFVSNNILQISVKNAGIESPCIIAPNKVGFDAFVGDMLLSVSCGFKIVMASEEELVNPHLFVKAIKKNRVNLIQTTPTRLNMSVLNYSPETLKRFKVIVCGGEPLVDEVIKQISTYATDSTLINVYGPTETTVWSAAANITAGDKGIGFPAQNTRCYILNRFQKFIPNYETGILYIGGDGLGCYCFDPINQKEKYIYVEGIDEQIYNSGDTAYLDNKYFLIYGSRADSQVKINGVRIELGDIESLAKRSPHIKDCAAAVKDIPSVGRRLALFYTSDSNIEISTFRTLLSQLPDAYIPSYFIRLSVLPLTSSNKIDRKSLPIPEIENNDEIVLPTTKLEKVLYAAINQLLDENGLKTAISINTPISNYGINSHQKGSINSYLESKGFSFPDAHKLINVHKSIFEISKSLEATTKQKTIVYDFPKHSFERYLKKGQISRVLLTGAAGFLGSHVLASLLINTKAEIICLYHNSSISEIFEKYHTDVVLDEKRVKYVYGTLSEKNFGLSDDDLELVESVDSIINCAAFVKYYGEEETFYKSNVLSVKNLCEFAIKNKIVLNHISTLSVLGSEANREITEKDFWFGQNEIFNNQYVESKFLAENEIIKSAENGLKYRVFRVGRLAWRRDGIFQHNCNENEFYATLKIFEHLNLVPKELLDISIEISPIDGCANAIVMLSSGNIINGTFHIMNDNLVTLSFIIECMNESGCRIKSVPMTKFMQEYNRIPDYKTNTIRDDDQARESIYKSVTNVCCISENEFHIEHNDYITNNLTKKALPTRFKWPEIDCEYFRCMFSKDKE